MDTLKKLQKAWKPNHFEHVIGCLQYCQSYFEDHFEYQGVKDDGIVIDGKLYSQSDIIKILADQYTYENSDYQSSLGDAIFLFFTDLVEDDVDILSKIDEEVA